MIFDLELLLETPDGDFWVAAFCDDDENILMTVESLTGEEVTEDIREQAEGAVIYALLEDTTEEVIH